ncbi:MAG: hypothetical protein PHF86_08590 [Candidatus Nanoarchaeia archaeon]|jgi:hypothetical protein|nr:hypothetical protein [Candidatus Nanoarchaeia archaeon]
MTAKFDFISKINKETYNTIYGIEQTFSSYETFVTMLRNRHDAYYIRKEELEEFVLFGALRLDTCGNVWKLEKRVRVPKVVTIDDFRHIESSMSTYMWSPPHFSTNCFHCQKNWSIETQDFLECHFVDETIELDSGLYIGLSIIELNEILKQKTDGRYYLNYDEKEKNIIIEKGQKIFCRVRRYFHKDCMEQHVQQQANQIFEIGGKDYNRFWNLAGDVFCDYFIEMELKLVGIPVETVGLGNTEVPFTKFGFIEQGPFIFKRAWYYWVVNGPVPLDVANDLYADPVGAKDVRVVGHCGCPAPEQWTTDIDGEKYIMSYHIDSLPGLKLFVNKIKEIKHETISN